MRVVVTGAAGFIGSNLVHGLNAVGIDDVIAVDEMTDGAKYRNLLGAQLADYFEPPPAHNPDLLDPAPHNRTTADLAHASATGSANSSTNDSTKETTEARA